MSERDMLFELPIRILESGGTRAVFIAVLGTVAICWGAVNLIRRHGRSANAGQLVAAVLPTLCGLWCFGRAYFSYSSIALSDVAPAAPEFHLIVSTLISIGLLSLIATVVPVSLGVACLFKGQVARGV